MKKVALVIALIAVLIGATYGGVAFAGKPTGRAPLMESDSARVYLIKHQPLSFQYPQVRHVSLTLGTGLDVIPKVEVDVDAGVLVKVAEALLGPYEALLCEFDASEWCIVASETGEYWYNITTTYPK